MSDARSEAIDPEAAPQQLPGRRLSEADIIAAARLDVLGDGSLKEALASASPNGPAPTDKPISSPDVTPQSASAEADDLQPMLDLRFPEPPPQAGALDVATPAPEPVAEASAETPPHEHERADQTPPHVAEVSPIFSALDAADRAAAETIQRDPAFAPARVEILLPAQPPFEGAQPVAPMPTTEEHAATQDTAASEVDLGDLEAQAVASDAGEPPRPILDIHSAAARIAEEANATAEALEGLKRLLGSKLPLVETPVAVPHDLPSAEDGEFEEELPAAPPPPPAMDSAAVTAHFAVLAEPVTPPPMVPLPPAATIAELSRMDPPRRRSGVAIGSFLAGLAVSGVLGAVLYVYLNMI